MRGPEHGGPVIDTARLRRVGGGLGSHPAGVYEDEAGRRWYVKTLESRAQADNERLAARLYRLAGAPVLRQLPTARPDQVATEWLVLDKRHLAHFSAAERRQAQHWLGVHAWLANWDAAGFAGDNQGVAAGTVYTLDVGGALEFRAQGEPKGRAFGTTVGELDTLRHSADNPQARRLFGDMQGAQIGHAIRVVTALAPARIRQVLAEAGARPALADTLIARQADMARRLAAEPAWQGGAARAGEAAR